MIAVIAAISNTDKIIIAAFILNLILFLFSTGSFKAVAAEPAVQIMFVHLYAF